METYSAVGSVAAAAAAAPNKPLLPLPIPSMLAAIARASNASSSSIIDEDAADGGKDAVGAGVCGVAPAEAGGAKGALDPIPSMLAAIARANSASSSAYPPPRRRRCRQPMDGLRPAAGLVACCYARICCLGRRPLHCCRLLMALLLRAVALRKHLLQCLVYQSICQCKPAGNPCDYQRAGGGWRG